jgi:hypothetical protein
MKNIFSLQGENHILTGTVGSRSFKGMQNYFYFLSVI